MSTTEVQPDAAMFGEPQAEHRWLQRLVGEWIYLVEVTPEPGKPPMEPATGTETVRPFGDLWILGEGQGGMCGLEGTMQSLLTLGYDPQTGRFVGTFVGSFMTHLWVYANGALDAAERVLTLESEGPSMAGDGSLAKYRDIVTLESDDKHVLTSQVLNEHGQWHQFMTMTFRRVK